MFKGCLIKIIMEVDMSQAVIGVIGGSGLYDIPGLEQIDSVELSTPFGDPSDSIAILEVHGVPVAFLPRHGRGHKVSPTFVNSRANIFAMKKLGVEYIISVSAVGSLKESIHPRDFVIPDQIIDRTKSRVNSFYEPYAVHVGFAEPFCPVLAGILAETGRLNGNTVHEGGTYVCMEGPLFSTKAESNMHRNWGASVIGMTALPEAKLAREAEICYATVALVTDYDVWKEDEIVEIETVLSNIKANVTNVRNLVLTAVPKIVNQRTCLCANALQNAIITDTKLIPAETKKLWKPLLEKYGIVD
jgi:5'-methylthioadenosine phosphorylase